MSEGHTTPSAGLRQALRPTPWGFAPLHSPLFRRLLNTDAITARVFRTPMRAHDAERGLRRKTEAPY